MDKKWLCLFVAFVLLVLPLSGMDKIEQRDLIARALTATGGASSDEALMALGCVAMNRANGPDVERMSQALDEAGFSRGFLASDRATRIAQALIDGERTLDNDIYHFAKSPPDGPYTRIASFYFY